MPNQVELGPILVLAPVGRDAPEIQRVLGAAGLSSRAVADMNALCRALGSDGGAGFVAVFVAEEAFADGMDSLVDCLGRQPPWSDMPIVLLTAGGSRRGAERRWTLFGALGNVTLLTRPLHTETLQSAGRAAVRARVRQHQTRQHLDALRVAAETLEQRVEDRTRDLMAMEQTLRQAQKMEAVGQLTGGLAHDFNNMLTGITGSLDLLSRRLTQGRTGDLDRYIVAAQDGARRAAALTHRLLAFSRRQTLDPRPVDADQLVMGMEELIQRTVGPAIQVETDLGWGPSMTLCDPHQLENALLNLCINARDAMPDGGRLTIATADAVVDDGGTGEQDIAPGRYVALSVSDTGTGMPPEIVARAFDPFFTTKPLGQGTGLGLSMIYGFARQSSGTVRILSEVGRGTTVQILLPRHERAAGPAALETMHEPPPRLDGRGVVLVVDDEPTVRMLVRELLTDLGYTILEADDGRSALKILRSGVQLDLLITDVGLPGGMNGRQIADAARDVDRGLRILFITGYAEQTVLGADNLPGGMHVMTKPFRTDDLAQRVRDLTTCS